MVDSFCLDEWGHVLVLLSRCQIASHEDWAIKVSTIYYLEVYQIIFMVGFKTLHIFNGLSFAFHEDWAKNVRAIVVLLYIRLSSWYGRKYYKFLMTKIFSLGITVKSVSFLLPLVVKLFSLTLSQYIFVS